MSVTKFTGVVVFSATKANDRDKLGDAVTKWIKDNPLATVVDKSITQSSDSEFHCFTIALFYDAPANVKIVDTREPSQPRNYNNGTGANNPRPHAPR